MDTKPTYKDSLFRAIFNDKDREVLDMINFEWDPVRAKEVACEEARTEERIETTKRVTNDIALSLLKNKAPMKLITESTHLSIEEVEKIAREHQLAV